MRSIIPNLTPASGRQDHTTSPSARVRSRQQRRPRPSHPLPYVRDDRETPLCVGRDGARCRSDLGQKGTEIFLQRGLDRANQLDPVQQIALSAQGRSAQRIAPTDFLDVHLWIQLTLFGATAVEKASQPAGQQDDEQGQYQPHAESAPVLKFLETFIRDHQDDRAHQWAPDGTMPPTTIMERRNKSSMNGEDGRPHDAKVGGIDRARERREKGR